MLRLKLQARALIGPESARACQRINTRIDDLKLSSSSVDLMFSLPFWISCRMSNNVEQATNSTSTHRVSASKSSSCDSHTHSHLMSYGRIVAVSPAVAASAPIKVVGSIGLPDNSLSVTIKPVPSPSPSIHLTQAESSARRRSVGHASVGA